MKALDRRFEGTEPRRKAIGPIALTFVCDTDRHLVCLPYSVENLHRMAQMLGIKRCWYHRGASYPHYDIPKRRIAEVSARCEVVSGRAILAIVKGLDRRSKGIQP